MQREGILRIVAAAADDFVDHVAASNVENHACADGAPVRLSPLQVQIQEVAVRGAILYETWGRVHVHQDYFRPPIAVEIANRKTARWSWHLKCRSCHIGDVLKFPITQVAVQERWFKIRVSELFAFDFGVNMAVGNHQVPPSIVVYINKGDSPSQQLPIS